MRDTVANFLVFVHIVLLMTLILFLSDFQIKWKGGFTKSKVQNDFPYMFEKKRVCFLSNCGEYYLMTVY